MPTHKDKVFEDWWPLAQSLILVRGPIDKVAGGLKAQFKRWDPTSLLPWWKRWRGSKMFNWEGVSSIDAFFRSIAGFTPFPTVYYALPTRGPWTVIWNNGAHCDGHDSLASCLTKFENLETLAFYSTDRNSIMLAGTSFTHRRSTPGEESPRARSVYCCNQGKRWYFRQSGEPLPEEDLSRYTASPKRERLNEEGLMALLKRLGASPWHEDYYDLQNAKFFKITNAQRSTESSVRFEQIRARAMGARVPGPQEEHSAETELKAPPGYLRGCCIPPEASSPAQQIVEAERYGKNQDEYKLFDIRFRDSDRFLVQLPVPESGTASNPPVVKVTCEDTRQGLFVFDIRQHPGSDYFGANTEPELQSPEACPNCGYQTFYVSIGFGIHPESDGPDDTSWFALAVRCVNCRWSGVIYEDEAR